MYQLKNLSSPPLTPWIHGFPQAMKDNVYLIKATLSEFRGVTNDFYWERMRASL